MEDKKRLVKYPNELNLNKLGFLTPVAQDIFINILTEFTTKKSVKIEIPLSQLKENSRLSNKSESDFLKKMVEINEMLIKKLVFTVQFGERDIYTSSLFPHFHIQDKVLKTEIDEKFAGALYEFESYFTKFPTEQFIDVRGKHTKSLYRLFRKNFKGKTTIKIEDLKEWLCLSQNYATNNLRRVLQKAVDELIEKNILKSGSFEFIYSSGRGRPLSAVYFEYTFSDEKIAELAGQTTLNYQPVTEKKTIIEDEIIRPDKGLPHIKSTAKVIETDKKCPYCGSQVITRIVTGNTENKGKRYEKCIKNDFSLYGNKKCGYYRFID